ncbi:MAG: hypothetical protein FWE91_10755 [Defluviitaleaceae bacterium]|nr:hypothetical protein [Defluviitaleaceae bacterium]MCL2836337.1 hypothetical protein [Defluviitaleaceae bacterium]
MNNDKKAKQGKSQKEMKLIWKYSPDGVSLQKIMEKNVVSYVDARIKDN